MSTRKVRLYLKTPFIFREVGYLDVPEGVQTLYVPVKQSPPRLEVHTWPIVGMEERTFTYRYQDPVSGEDVFVHDQKL